MTAIALRKELQQYISHADERFLRMVYSLAKEYSKEGLVGYSIGKPISKSRLLHSLTEADTQIEKGEYITIDALEKESETW
jgi:hypothetical protein